MKEELLHYLWKTRKLDLSDLQTTEGEEISVLKFGTYNHNAGPDFLNGQVKIGTTTWNGHIEMHTKASYWNTHKHQEDAAYSNVILHVVYDNNAPIKNANGQPIPTLELKDRIPSLYLDGYHKLLASLSWIPCSDLLAKQDKSRIPFFLERLVVNRLERKQTDIQIILQQTKNDWEQVLYRTLLKYLGLKINGEAFVRLSEALPYSILKRQAENLFQKESILFGQAGLLNNQDAYFEKLDKEYQHQKTKYNLTPMKGVEWLFSKLRPANFPTIRIAQIAALYHQTPDLFSRILESSTVDELKKLFNVTASEYWNTHYVPSKESVKRKKKIGGVTIDILIINVIVPLMFTYGSMLDNEKIKEQALDLLYAISAENNSIIRKWTGLGIKAESAAHSQALIELKTNYCDNQKCLDCQVGQQIIFG